jgi:cell division protein FtsZ
MQDAGTALMGIGSARGAERAIKATEMAAQSPLLDQTIDGAHGVLLSIQGGSNLGIHEINEAASLITEHVHPDANVIFGMSIDDTLGDEVRVTVIAAGFDVDAAPRARVAEPRVESFNTSEVDRVDELPFVDAQPTTEQHNVAALTETFDNVSDDYDLPEFLRS